MNLKKIMFILCLLLAVLTVSSVCAADNQTDMADDALQENPSDCIGLNEDIDEEIISSSQTEVLGNTSYSSLKNLQEDIDNTDAKATLALDRDYAYSEADEFSVITIDKSLTIEGNGHSISQGHIYVSSGIVVFHNISFVNCYSKYNDGADNGGAIAGDNVRVIDCKFTNCLSQGEGGAIYGENNIITNCVFTSCKAKNGAAVAGNHGKFTNCTFTANEANAYGGAIYGSYCTVIGSHLNDNVAEGCGGAIYGYKANVQNSSFNRNTAKAISPDDENPLGGGAIFSSESIVVNCYFYGNVADCGGAMFNGAAVNCTFRGNNALNESNGLGEGGAIFNAYAADSYFYNNHAGKYGGAGSHSNCVNCTFKGNTAGLKNHALQSGGFVSCKFVGDKYEVEAEFKDIQFYPNSEYTIAQGESIYIHEDGVFGNRQSIDGYFITIVEAYQDGVLKAVNYLEQGKPFWKVALAPGNYECVLRMAEYKSKTISLKVTAQANIQASDLTTTYGGGGMTVTITDALGNPLKQDSCTVRLDNNQAFWENTDEYGQFTINPDDLEQFGNPVGSHVITITYHLSDSDLSVSKTVNMVINKADAGLQVSLENDSYYGYENVTFNIDATHPKAKGNVSLSINGLTYNFTDCEIKNINITIPGLPTGTYDYTVTFAENDYFTSSVKSGTVIISKYLTSLNLEMGSDFYAGDTIEIIATVSSHLSNVNGTVTIYGTAGNTTISIVNGTGKGNFTGVKKGNYSVYGVFEETDFYSKSNVVNKTVNVVKYSTEMVLNITNAFGDVKKLTVKVTSNCTKYSLEKLKVCITGHNPTLNLVLNGNGEAETSILFTATSTTTYTLTGTLQENDYFEVSSATKQITVSKKSKTTTKLTFDKTYVNQAITIKVEVDNGEGFLSLDAGSVIVTLNGTQKTVKLNNAFEGTARFDSLPAGSYDLSAVYSGTSKYAGSSVNTKLTVYKYSAPEFTVNVSNITPADDEDVVVKFSNDFYPVNVTVKDENSVVYTVNETISGRDGNSSFIIFKYKNLPSGKYDVSAVFAGNETHESREVTAKFNVTKIATNITGSNGTIYLILGNNVSSVNLTPAEAGNLSISVSNSSVVKVENGKIISLATGKSTITFSFAGNDRYEASEDVELTVIVYLYEASVSVVNSTVDLFVGGNSTIVPVTSPDGLNVTYSVDNVSVVGVDENGVVTALGEGSAIVTVTIGGDGSYAMNSTTVSVTVSRIPTNISVDKSEFALKVTDVVDIGAVLNPAGAGNLSYAVSNSSVVKVEEGKIVALTSGVSNVIISFAGDYKYAAADNVTVKVTVSPHDASVSVVNSTVDLFVDGNSTIVANTSPDGLDITYSVDNESVVSVDENGVITALGEGSAIVTVSIGDDRTYARNSTAVSVTVSRIPTNISVDKSEFALKVTDVVDIGAVLNPAGAGNLSYAVSNSSVVKVEEGKIIALVSGESDIVISFAGDFKYAAADNVTVKVIVSPHDASVSVVNSTIDLLIGDTDIIVPVTSPGSLDVTYSVDNESVVYVDGKGKVTPLNEGSAVVTVSVGDDVTYARNFTTVKVTVSRVPTSISVEKDSVSLIIGGNVSVGAVLTPADAGNLLYSVSNSSVVKVEDGKIIALANGESNVTISFAGDFKYAAADNVTVKVTVKPYDASVSVVNSTVDLFVGGNGAIVAVTSPDGLDVTYSVDNESVVSVDGDGVITALGEGSAVVTVSIGDDVTYARNSTAVKVTVSKIPTNISVVKDVVSLIKGNNVSVGATLNPSDAGNLTYVVSNSSVIKIENGKIIALANGESNVTISFAGDFKYAAADNVTVKVIVRTDGALVSVDVSDVKFPENVVVNVNVTAGATGNVSVTINNITKTLKLDRDSKAQFTFEEIPAGNYTVYANYAGDDNYIPAVNDNEVVNVQKADSVLDVSVPSVVKVGDDATIIVNVTNKGATGSATITVNGFEATETLKDGKATFTVPSSYLPQGNYSADVSYSGDKNYTKVDTKTQTFTVRYADNEDLQALIDEAVANNQSEVNLTHDYVFKENGTVEIPSNITVNGNGHTIDANGSATAFNITSDNVTINNMTISNVNGTAVTSNGTNAVISDVALDNVNGTAIQIDGDNASINNLTASNTNGTLIDVTGDNTSITNVNSTDNSTIALDGKVGKTENITGATIIPSIKATSTVKGSDVIVTVVVSATEGKVTVKFNGKNYSADLVDGKAAITIPNVERGTYSNIPVVYEGTALYQSVSTTTGFTSQVDIIGNKDITTDYLSGYKYTVRILNADGSYAAGITVKMTVNGVIYNIKTDNAGYAKLLIKLKPKTYKITVEYLNVKKTNTIKVKYTLKLVKKTVKVKKTAKKLVLKAKLKWSTGKAIKGKIVKFKFKGKTYKAKTNKKGIAKVKIKQKVIKKLKKGKKYKFKVKYVKEAVKGKVKVKK